MVKQDGHSVGMDPSRLGPGSGIPTQPQASYRLWLLAVAAGVVETALVVVDASDGEVGSAAQVAVGVAVGLLAFAGLVDLAVRLRQGRNWARVALAVLLGGPGTLSLVIGPVTWLAEGRSPVDAVAAADLGSVLFAASRVLCLGAVIAALILMFTRPPTPTSKQPCGLPPGAGRVGGERRRSQMIDAADQPATTRRRSASSLPVGVTAVILDALSFQALGRPDPAARRQRAGLEPAWQPARRPVVEKGRKPWAR
jgi:hypothetical protein